MFSNNIITCIFYYEFFEFICISQMSLPLSPSHSAPATQLPPHTLLFSFCSFTISYKGSLLYFFKQTKIYSYSMYLPYTLSLSRTFKPVVQILCFTFLYWNFIIPSSLSLFDLCHLIADWKLYKVKQLDEIEVDKSRDYLNSLGIIVIFITCSSVPNLFLLSVYHGTVLLYW